MSLRYLRGKSRLPVAPASALALLFAGCLLSKDPDTAATESGKDTTVVTLPDSVKKTDTPKIVVTLPPGDTAGKDTIKVAPIKPAPPKIRPEMIRMQTAAPALGKRGAAPAAGPHWTSAVRLASFRTPITKIVLQNAAGNNGAVIYSCRTGDCRVDLASATVEDILRAAPMDIRPGIYTNIQFEYCAEGARGYEALVTAEVTLDDTVWYTQAGSSLSKTGPATPAAIAYNGCGRLFALPRPVEIPALPGDTLPRDTGTGGTGTGGPGGGPGGGTGSGTGGGKGGTPLLKLTLTGDTLVPSDTGRAIPAAPEIRLRLFFDVENLVWAGLNEHASAWAWAPGNCTGPHPDMSMTDETPFICSGYPDVAGTTDSAAPILERYYLNGSAVLGIFFSGENGNFLGGYSRRFLREGSDRIPGFEPVTPIRDFNALDGGNYHLELFGGGSHGEGSDFQTDDFRREPHTGGFTSDRFPAGTYEAVMTRP